MAGYLEEYGAGEDKRENLIRNTILITLAVLFAGGLLFYLFRPIHQISLTKHFLNALRAKDYPGAYAAWGCTAASPCQQYPYDKFLEDWGPKSAAGASPDPHMTDIESCGKGEIVSVNMAPGDRQSLFAEKGTDVLSFSPTPVCPGKSTWSIMIHRTLGRMRQILF